MAKVIISSHAFILITTSLILANTVVLSLSRYPITDTEVNRIEQANLAFTLIFTIEMIVIIFALGLRRYVRDPFNLFDVIIVFISLVDSALNQAETSIAGKG